ncbi:uncharacterized protein K441DRAFT_237487 [Cenococcum geophilum 1.58]|uniref:uncharacterized protein n=1 Tax=Cenococcum geophilum 1.58 TaxID=794803 RepID=UPI00358EDCB4|nr:hypothetical protein K441DRAFT_237487 [Cenococcum geophilum 1.58]
MYYSQRGFGGGCIIFYHSNWDPLETPVSKSGLGDIVTAGKKFVTTWKPTTSIAISLVLLQEPSTNVVPVTAIAEEISNTGTFGWTPSTSLESDSHYGLQLIVDSTGQYRCEYGPEVWGRITEYIGCTEVRN